MFYAEYVLNKKGPLARIWLAAHWDKKLTKANVFETNIEKSVDGILQPKVKLALRTSGHLMLGVVRIYSKKEKYLLADCNEAFVKIKMAFRPGMVDLPEEKREAAVNAITLPEVFHDFDTPMPELNDVDIQAQFSFNQSRAEEITMREDYGNISLVTGDDGFGDMGFDAEPPELMRDAPGMEQSLEGANLLFDNSAVSRPPQPQPQQDTSEQSAASKSGVSALELDAPIRDDGFGGHLGQDIMSGGLFDGGLFDDAPMAEAPPATQETTEVAPAPPPPPPSVPPADTDDHHSEDFNHFDASPAMGGGHSTDDDSRPGSPAGAAPEAVAPQEAAPTVPDIETPAHDQTTLVQNEDETFALPPVDTSTLRGLTRTKRKRKLIVDEVKNISGEEMKNQLSDTSDIVTTLDLAPPTKRLMHWKETGGVEKLFALPGRNISATCLSRMYVRHLTSRPIEYDEFGDELPAGLTQQEEEELQMQRHLELMRQEENHQPPAKPGRKKRKVQQRQPVEEPEEEEPQAVPQQQPQPPEEPPAAAAVVPELAPPPPPAEQQQQQAEPAGPAAAPVQPSDQAGPEQPDQPPSAAAPAEPEPPVQAQPSRLDNLGFDQSQTPAEPVSAATATALPEQANASLANMGYDENLVAPATPGALSDRGPLSVHSTGPATPWQEDLLGQTDEAQLEGETYAQFEDRVNNKRAAVMYHVIKSRFDTEERISFSDLCRRNHRKQVAQKFYTTLVLKKLQVLELEQECSYSPIQLSRGACFSTAQL